jgi:hypothetical protein
MYMCDMYMCACMNELISLFEDTFHLKVLDFWPSLKNQIVGSFLMWPQLAGADSSFFHVLHSLLLSPTSLFFDDWLTSLVSDIRPPRPLGLGCCSKVSVSEDCSSLLSVVFL